MDNGHDNAGGTRLDRIEGIIEALATRQADIETDLAQLLKAQIVFGDEVGKAFKAANSRMAEHERRMDRVDAALERWATKAAETEDKLNALITLMDRHLREHDSGRT